MMNRRDTDDHSHDPYRCDPAGPGTPLLRCEALEVGYAGVPILPPIDAEVRHGALVAVVGRNGAGKTTLFRTLLGLLPPVGGRIVHCVEPLPMGYVAQRSALQPIMPLSVRDVVTMGLERQRSFLWSTPKRRRRQAVEEALEQMKARDLAKQSFGALSEGQKQRVLLARLLVGKPQLAVMDEPTAAMDAVAEEETLDLVRSLCADHAMAVLIVSHNVRAVAGIADQMLFLDRATQSVTQGLPSAVFGAQEFRGQYGRITGEIHLRDLAPGLNHSAPETKADPQR